jgi:hypothetical protein
MFGHPSQGAASSVARFADHLESLGLDDGDAIALDHEVTDGHGPAAVSAWAGSVMFQLATKFARPPLLYTFRSFAAEGNCAGLGGYPLWISDPDHTAGHPTVPAPWKTYAIHQYGTSGAIDRDFAAWQSLAAMRAALGRILPPKPKPVPAAEADMIIIRVNQTTVPAGTDWPGVFLVGGGVFHHVTTTDAQAAYQSAGIKGPVVVDYAEYLEWAAGK